MTRPVLRRAVRSRSQAVAVLVGCLLLAACVSLPTEGPVIDAPAPDRADTRRASDIDARPPAKGASRTEVVSGFLEAMTAWPIQTSVAKEYLTEEAAAQWKPERGTVIYSDIQPARESGGAVEVKLTSAQTLDEVGSWRGPAPESELTLRFRVTVVGGEYRIADPTDALIVPANWFQQRYRQVSLYYFDPIAQILVPEPIFVPEGEQLASNLVTGLLSGPPPLARGLVRSFLPRGLTVGLSVPVDSAGIAHLDLVGEAPRVTAEEAELILAQLAWTLRQDSEIKALQVTIGGADLPIPGGASQYPVSAAQAFDPAGDGSTALLFGLAGGRLVWGSSGNLSPAASSLGDRNAGLTAVAASPDSDNVAVVDAEGRRVRIAPARGSGAGVEIRTVLSGGIYARPTWDMAGRLWILERRTSGAVVWLVEDDRPRQVRVPGITGSDARQLIVSRDGTRLVAVVRTAVGDEIVGARVSLNARGRVARSRSPFVVRAAEGTRVIDIVWRKPTRIAVLVPTSPGNLYEVDVVAVDGASFGTDLVSSVVTGPVVGIAGSPAEGGPLYSVFADRYFDVVSQEEFETSVGPLTELHFGG